MHLLIKYVELFFRLIYFCNWQMPRNNLFVPFTADISHRKNIGGAQPLLTIFRVINHQFL